MSVNLSPRQFLDPDLANGIRQVLRRRASSPARSSSRSPSASVMDRSEAEPRRAPAAPRARRAASSSTTSGPATRRSPTCASCRWTRSRSTGRSSTDLDVRDPNVGIIRAVVSLAHGLGITVVAEGIETDEQARRLRELGCDMGQGYAWAHPAEPIRVGAVRGSRRPVEAARHAGTAVTPRSERRAAAGAGGLRRRLSGGRRTAAAGTGTG